MKNKINVGELVCYHPFIGKPAVSSGHKVKAISLMPNNFGDDVAWITGKSGCISFNCLTHDETPMFVLRDSRSNLGSNMMFWRDGGSYTSDLLEAELFTENDAMAQHNRRETDIPLLYAQLLKAAQSRVDHQYLPDTVEIDLDDEVVYQIRGCWDGNDIKFISSECGKSSYDYSDALFSVGRLPASTIKEMDLVPWRKLDIDVRVRKSVQANSLIAVNLNK